MAETTAAAPRRLAPRRIGSPSRATGALIALLAVAAIVLLLAGRHLTFYADEWIWIQGRRDGGIDTFLAPHNEHLSLFPVAVYKLLFALVGMRHYTVYRAVGVAIHLLCAVLLYVLVRRRIGPWLALVPTALLLLMGTAGQDLLWPFQIGFMGSVAGGLGALALVEDRRSDVLATLLLLWSVCSSGVGLAFMVACLVALLVQRDPWSRLWIVAVPAVVYGAWYIGWGHSQPITLDVVLGVPASVADSAAGIAAAIAGLNTAVGATVVTPWGPALLIAGVAGLVICWRRNVATGPTAMLLASTAGVLTFWGLIALQRSGFHNLNTSRYLYIGAVFVWLIAAEARAGVGLRGWGLAAAGVLAAGALIANVSALRALEVGLRIHDDGERASLTAVDIAAPVVRPGFLPDPVQSPTIVARPYLAAAHALGSPAFTLSELQSAPYSLRQRVDGVLERAESLAVVPAVPAAGCVLTRPVLARPALSLDVYPGRTAVIRNLGPASVKLYLRRFTPGFGPPRFALLGPRSTSALRFPLDLAPGHPWHLLLVPGRGVATCLR